MTFPRFIFVFFSPALWLIAMAGDQPLQAALLQSSAAAMAQVKTVTYSFHYQGSGSLSGHFSGRVWIRRGKSPMESSFRVEMKSHAANPDKSQSWWLTSHQMVADMIEFHQQNHRRGRLDKGNAHLISNMYYAVWFQFVSSGAFDNELLSGKLSSLPQQYIAGIATEGVRIEQKNSPYGDLELGWHFGKQDHFPRAQSWKNLSPGQEGQFRFEIEDLHVDLNLSDELFRLNTPKGFSFVDEDQRIIAVGTQAPDWTLKQMAGGDLSLSQFKGKVVILDFWASWCPPCASLMPQLEQLAKNYADRGVVVLGLNTWESEDINRVAFLKKHKVSYPILLNGESLAESYKLASLPGLFVIGRQGQLIFIANALQNPNFMPQMREALEQELSR